MDIRNYLPNPYERPLDIIKPDGGYTAIFRTIACIGDSLASGEFESLDENNNRGYHDMYEYSWGQFIARATGSKVYNFSRGGMKNKQYIESFANENDMWNPDKAAQAYIIALGCNDISRASKQELYADLGTINDVDFENCENNKPTYAGYYAKIIQRYKKIQPKARFFLMTFPNEKEPMRALRAEEQRKLLYQMSEKFEFTYVIDLLKYGPVYDEEFKNEFYLSGHLNPMGYLFTAQIVMSYIDYIIRHNPDDFSQIGFIGTPYYNVTRKY